MSNFHFGESSFAEIDAKGDDAETGGAGVSDESVDFTAVQQQFTVSASGVVEIGASFVGSDVGIFHPHLSVVDVAETVGERRLSRSDAFDFRSGQHDSCAVAVKNQIVKSCAAVLNVHRT